MACVDICPNAAITVEDNIEWMDARIDENKCMGCGLCHRVCQKNHPAELRRTIVSYQGWAQPAIRMRGSSGGFATAVMESFVQSKGPVASCRLADGEFKFFLARDSEELAGFSGSKYVKSNPEGIYKSIASELKSGGRVLFIGLPCQVSSMRNFISLRRCPEDNLYTIDLICHGSPSIKLLSKALEEYGYDINQLQDVSFRENERFGLRAGLKHVEPAGVIDRYLAAFLKGGLYTQNCYSCHYAQKDRVSDLTLGDSWGTELKEEEAGGISLALVQTEKGEKLLRDAGVELRSVDYQNAVAHNHQLQHPSEITPEREVLFSKLNSGSSFKAAVFAAYPQYCLKQKAKGALGHLGIRRGGGYSLSVIPKQG